jgi:hypothetical protein
MMFFCHSLFPVLEFSQNNNTWVTHLNVLHPSILGPFPCSATKTFYKKKRTSFLFSSTILENVGVRPSYPRVRARASVSGNQLPEPAVA